MGTLRTRLRSWFLLVFLASLLALVIAILVLKPHGNITQANFQKIGIGMTQSDLRRLLGPPDYQTVEIGLVQGPVTYSIYVGSNKEGLRQKGYRDYTRQQWTSAERTIIAILDSEGRVVCRYIGAEPNRISWLDVVRYWISRLL